MARIGEAAAHLTSSRSKDWLLDRSDGVVLSDPTVLMRARKCALVLEELSLQALRILRSPPGSGKSSLAALLKNSCSCCTMVNLAFWNTHREPLETFWQRMFVTPLEVSLDPTEGQPRVFIIDEAQKTFQLGMSHPFWQALKAVNAMDMGASRVRVLLLGVYCEPASPGGVGTPTFATPVEIRNGWSLAFLSLDETEIADLFAAFNASCAEHLCPKIPASLQGTMCHVCGSHVGLLRSSILQYARVFRNHPADLSAPEETAFIRDELLKLGVGGTLRALPKLSFLTAGAANWLQRVALEGQDGLRLDLRIDDDLARLITAGIFDYNDTTRVFQFSSRLMRSHALQQLFGSLPSSPITNQGGMSAIDVAREVVKRMNRHTLRESLSSLAEGTLLERQYQMTFFAAAVSALPGMTVNPDYGFHADSKAYLDFFIDGKLNVGIALTRDGKKLQSHGQRLKAGGAYAPLGLSSWTVVDFRKNWPQTASLEKHRHCLFVCFSADFSEAALFQHGKRMEKIALHDLGDSSAELGGPATAARLSFSSNPDTSFASEEQGSRKRRQDITVAVQSTIPHTAGGASREIVGAHWHVLHRQFRAAPASNWYWPGATNWSEVALEANAALRSQVKAAVALLAMKTAAAANTAGIRE